MGVHILHLSDLHLPISPDPEFYSFQSKLTNTIKQHIKEYGEIDVVIVTGDIINRGEIACYESTASNFFEGISRELIDPNRFIFAAGNHDSVRDATIRNLVSNKKTELFSTISSLEAFDHTYCFRYSHFLKFVNNFTKSPISKSYYACTKPIKGYNIRFVVINSSVCTYGADFGRIGISTYQLNSLVEQSQKEPEADLVIALMHHPINWFSISEQTIIYDYFEDKMKLGVDIVMHGHTHEGKVYGNYDVDGLLLNLVSGIGYEESKKRKTNGLSNHRHRIAFYDIDPSNKHIVGYLMQTNDKRVFVPDTSLYRSVDNNGRFELFYGEDFLKRKIPEIKLPVDSKIIVDQRFIDETIKCQNALIQIENLCLKSLQGLVSEYRSKKKGVDSRNKDEMNKLKAHALKTYMGNIILYYESIFADIPKGDFRLHFRIYNPLSDAHESISLPDGFKKLTPIRWETRNNLIHHAYRLKRSLIKSLNPTLCFDTNGEWSDYITCPIGDKMSPIRSERPLLSFGISIKGTHSQEAQRILYALSFLRIEEYLNRLMREFERNVGDYSKIKYYREEQ